MLSIRISEETKILLKRNKKFWITFSIVIFIVLLGIFGPLLTPYGPRTPTGTIASPPSLEHPFGVDYFGYDVFAQVVYGIRISLSAGVVAAIVATLIGAFLGIIAGFKGGWVDSSVEILTHIFLSIPYILLVLLIINYMATRGIVILGLLVGLFSWPWLARAVRSQVAALSRYGYVYLSLLSGNSSLKVIFKDILPNLASYILLSFVLQLNSAILAVVTLEFLGLGAAEWSLGGIVNLAVMWGAVSLDIWWWWLFPGIIMIALISSLIILTVSLEEVFNPRLRRV
ncbi:ABC transporter permease [Staphylothermus hellenicus]|uniref:Binding-protein-dependent transport systems inner membrane component n=1 Tax=Staphylothermus hellenicus (strain DSM 12710 / JCM 10830 / BK20S6-10-b1 / P8) TaxID=591019 RepID=D7D818_STAHD|nr:ABC transporter permease [Staphylothermus hellenicus]ADI31914.1 binding-protein-dependent transport systems inner membrane component [Staphylothermus hellenicus DSM 12710]